MFYQPITRPNGSVVAVEALLRWRHPERGLLVAGEFIALAIASGAMVSIGHWVIYQALAQLARWLEQYPTSAPALVFCNLSPQEVLDADLRGSIARSLHRHGLTPDRLGLEITEIHLADSRLADTLADYEASGHSLAIDDFGTGYSSLYRLVSLPVSYVKIDRSLVSGLPSNQRSCALVEAALVIADKLGLQVISEGVETPQQARWLNNAGCGLQQGMLHGHPMTAHDIDLRLNISPALLPGQ
ncbi:EAL domain-containing protein [Nakamurella sp. YIM 132084]|uniref:EAL domain-containing protein n=1 Tax=Nakamurella leprariae TaxID=2803911 RepID=A0A939BYK6_9ACTN|nr:EAL domain-containing protein [Nakamurella leprariae]